MEPATGNILALANVDRDSLGAARLTTENRAVTAVYEPASVMKAITFAALLDSGVITPESERWIDNQITVYDDTFEDTEFYEPMMMRPVDVLVRSSNTGTITYAGELGATGLHEYLTAFGFGEPTGLRFPYESPGLSPDLDEWSGTSLATISLGQGIAVTPLQMLAAYNVIANGGEYVTPRLIADIVDHEGSSIPQEVTPPRRVISSEAAADLTAMLTEVAGPEGTAHRAAVPGYHVAAKTGTARKVLDNGTYTDAGGNYHYITTVAGFFPAEKPAVSMIVVLEEPCDTYFASQVNAPLYGRLAAFTLRHLQITPPVEVQLAAPGASVGIDDADVEALAPVPVDGDPPGARPPEPAEAGT